MLYNVKVAYLKDGVSYVNEQGVAYIPQSKVTMTPDCAQHYIDQATEQGLFLSYEEETIQVSEEESLFYELGGYEVKPVPLTDPASINHRWQEFLNKMSDEEAHTLFVSLLALVKDIHVDEVLSDTEWDVADQIFELLKNKLDVQIELRQNT